MAELEKSILRTLSYFHLFNFPLTDWEIFKYLWRPPACSFSQTREALFEMRRGKTIGFREGFYFLKTKSDIIAERKKKYLISHNKISKNIFWLKILTRLPFIRAIFICNNLAYQNPSADSDIDLAIITASRRIWTTRFFTTAFFALFNKRPTPQNQANKICLSFYVAEDSFNLNLLANQEDIHFIYWLKQFLPIYAPQNILRKFLVENSWTKKFLPNYVDSDAPARFSTGDAQFLIKTILEWPFRGIFGDYFEAVFKKIQIKIMPPGLKLMAEENNTNVVISDEILKFHTKDRRLEIQQRWTALNDKISCVADSQGSEIRF